MSDGNSPLIGVEELAARLDEPGLAIVDCRHELGDPDAGRRAYNAGHIPGAVHAHLDEHLSGPVTAVSGRHPLPEPTALAECLGSWGIGADTPVVVYDEVTGPFAARLWWLLRWLGHDRVAVLDGGFRAWRAAGLPASTEIPEPAPQRFDPRPASLPTLDSERLAAELDDGVWRIVDARAPERYRGETEPVDPVAGHIPGAVNRPWTVNLDRDGRLRPAAELAGELEELLAGTPPERVVSSCGSGVTACHNLLSLEAAGIRGTRLHPGSWSEWIRDPGRPVERGA